MTRLLGILICLFIAATAYMSSTVSKRQQVLRHTAQHNDSWAISQAVSEFLRLESEVAAHELDLAGQSPDRLQLRLDIVYSRLASFKVGTLKTFFDSSLERRQLIARMNAIVARLDTGVEALSPADLRAVLVEMRALHGSLTSLSSQAVQQGWSDVESNLDALERLHAVYSIVVGFLILCWAGLIILLVRQNHLMKRAQRRAEILNDNLTIVGEELRDKNRSLEYVAHHDALTQLPNRILFWQELETVLKEAHAAESKISLLLFDLDNFKSINDTLGHDFGDLLLDQVSSRMLSFGTRAHMFCRLGGDEFACLLLRHSPEGARDFARALLAKLVVPYQLDNREVQIGCSVGIAHADHPYCREAQLLFKRADIGLYRAKDAPEDRICLFEDYMQAEFDDRKELENDLHLALERGEFHLVYQQQVDMQSRELRGFEALVRWHHPTRGEIQPGLFIALAEELGLIRELGHRILRAACTEAASWNQPLNIAVNLSPLQLLGQSEKLVDQVADTLRETGLDPARLELEITETVFLNDPKQGLQVLEELRALGVSIAMDDFGTGYSSLAMLRDIPFDTIKLDRSFVREIGKNTEAEVLLRLVVDIGRSMGKTVVIEGIETELQYRRILPMGCHLGQGFLFASPVPATNLSYLHSAEVVTLRQE